MKLVKYAHEYGYDLNLEIDSMCFDCCLMALWIEYEIYVHYMIRIKLYVCTLWLTTIWKLMNKRVCGPHYVVDKPCISLSDILDPAI